MATTRRRSRVRLGLTVDDRTEHLSETALACRRFGHDWKLKSTPRRRFLELIKAGHQEDVWYCACQSTKRVLWDVSNGEILETERTYPKNGEYLLPSGSGRLHRNAARVALFARQNPEYA